MIGQLITQPAIAAGAGQEFHRMIPITDAASLARALGVVVIGMAP